MTTQHACQDMAYTFKPPSIFITVRWNARAVLDCH